MRDDPFARLSGLDQQLFASRSPTRDAPASAARDNTPSNGGTAGRPTGRTAAPSSKPSSVQSSQRANRGTSGGTAQATAVQRAQRPNGGPVARTIDRRSYDFFHDQVLFLNRMKVELEERYDLQITANAMVQLALDLLILDHRRRGRHSHLMARLVFGQPLDGETAERPDVETAEPTEGGE